MIIRPASSDDADFLAWVMLHASRAQVQRGIWDLIIGGNEAQCIAYLRQLALAQPRSLCHSENFLIAQEDGKSAAALACFEVRPDAWTVVAQAMNSVQKELGWSEAEVRASRQRMAPLWPCFLVEVGADWCIESVATRPSFRRRGLVNGLIARALDLGRERGCKLAQITTFIGNVAAIAAYEKCGFRIAEEKSCEHMTALLDVPGFVRLLREL